MGSLLVLAIGILIGWNIPQPAFVKGLVDRLLARLRGDA